MNDLEKKSIECLKNMPIEETTYQVARNVVLDYITNLQEENKILKTRNKIIAEDITKDRINCDVIQTVCGIPIEEIPELKLCKSRNEKAIEYTKQFVNGKTSRIDEWENVELVLETIVQLLQGENKDGND